MDNVIPPAHEPLPGVELRHYRSFLAVADELNFTRAGRRLHVAQPALSTHVKQLERALGAAVFERSTHEVRLTDVGRVLRERVRPALAALAEAGELARRVATGREGALTLGYNVSSGYDTVPALLAAARATSPGLTIDAHVLATPAVPYAVATGQIDLAVARLPEPLHGVRHELLRREERGVLLSVNHPLAARGRLRTADLAGSSVRLHARHLSPRHFDETVALLERLDPPAAVVLDGTRFDPGMTRIASGELVGIAAHSAGLRLPPGLTWRVLADAPAVEVVLLHDPARPRPAVHTFLALARRLRDERGWAPRDSVRPTGRDDRGRASVHSASRATHGVGNEEDPAGPAR